MAKLRNLKKDVSFLAHDLNSIISVKVLVEGVDVAKFHEAIADVAAYKKAFLAQVNAPAVAAPKYADRKATTEQKLAVKAAYAKAVKAAYAEINKNLLQQYAELAEKISNIK